MKLLGNISVGVDVTDQLLITLFCLHQILKKKRECNETADQLFIDCNNSVLGRIFGSKRIEVTGDWRNLHNEKLHNLYSSLSIVSMIMSRGMKCAGHVARMVKRSAYRIFVEMSEGKRPLGRTRRRWVNSIKMDLREIGLGGMDWIDLVQDKDPGRVLVNTVMNFRVPQNVGKFLSSCTTSGFSKRVQLHEISYVTNVSLLVTQLVNLNTCHCLNLYKQY
jgi:hypothetical protein